ncbi:Similar to ssh: Protein phosphatase Slingshot (Drosophila melanogaster), partial [Cotesia congregata]
MALVTVQRSPSVSSSPQSSCYFAGKGAALVLPPNERARPSRRVSSAGCDIQQHLQSMFYLLRPEETLKMLRKMQILQNIFGGRKRVFISFCGFKPSEDEYIMKEFGIIVMKKKPSVKTGLFKPPSDWEKLTNEAQISYIEMEMKYGIPWGI